MRKSFINSKAITMVALVITIIILLILAGVTLNLTLGDNGLLQRTTQSKERTRKAEATEKVNLIISDSYLQSYKENKIEPTLQYIADCFALNNEVEYVARASQKTAADKIVLEPADEKIYVKLLEYPYEFEVNKNLKIASIDGDIIKDGSDFTSSEEYKQMLATINKLKEENENLQQEKEQIQQENEQVKQDNAKMQQEKEKLQSDYSNLQEEYETLKRNSKKVAVSAWSWKESATWNDAGISTTFEMNNELCSMTNGKIIIQKGGHYLISIRSINTAGKGAPQFQLFKNDGYIMSCNNNSTSGNVVKASMELDLNVGDVLYGKQYGGGYRPTIWLTDIYKLET